MTHVHSLFTDSTHDTHGHSSFADSTHDTHIHSLFTDGTRNARLTSSQPLAKFCTALEEVCLETVDGGFMTKDLALCKHGARCVWTPRCSASASDAVSSRSMTRAHYLNTFEFLDKIAQVRAYRVCCRAHDCLSEPGAEDQGHPKLSLEQRSHHTALAR